MRTLMMVSGIPMGGGERNIVSVLPFLRDGGCDTHLCTLNKRRDGPLADVLSRSGIERFDLGARRMTDLHAWYRFANYLREMKIDLIHAEDQDTIIYAGLAHLTLNVPTVMTRHVMIEPATSWKTTQRARLVFWSARYGMDHVIAVSDAVKTHFADQARISLAKITTIYNGIELKKFQTIPCRNEIRTKLGWELERPIVLFVSVLREGKGFDILFDAIPIVKAAVQDFHLKIVGGGELEQELRRGASQFNDTIEFMGERMDVPELLGASDVLVQASWSEALPTVLIEAGAASVPVVATDVGGTREIVKHGEGGFIVPAGNPEALARYLIELLKAPSFDRKMGDAAYRFVSQTFSLEKQASETIAVYERVLNNRI